MPLSTHVYSAADGGSTLSTLLNGTVDDLEAYIDTQVATAIAKALVDAKGDIIAATAADAVARVAVGTNGQVLTANSAQSAGLHWATPSGGGTGKSAVTFLVAASDAPQGVKDGAHYVCDGTADQAEINAAIDALPDGTSTYGDTKPGGGGRVRLSVGTFNISAPILANEDGVAIEGDSMGATKINVVSGFTGAAAIIFRWRGDNRPVLWAHLSDLYIHGNGIGTGIHGVLWRAARSKLERVKAHSCTGRGFVCQGYDTPSRWGTYSSQFQTLFSENCTAGGFLADTIYGEDCQMLNCDFFNSPAGPGLEIVGASWMVTGCYIWGNTGAGILMKSARCVIVGNKIEQNDHGLETGTGGSELLVVGNYFGSNSWTTVGTKDDIYLAGSGGSPQSVNISSNTFGNPYSGDRTRYAINIPSTNGNRILISNNAFAWSGDYTSGVILNQTQNTGNGFIISNNTEYITEKAGYQSSTPGAVTSYTFAHGLSVTPTNVMITPGNAAARDAPRFHASAGSTNITLTFASALAAATAYAWHWTAEKTWL